MKVFVTGGTGFIGSHLIAYLQEKRNAEVFALVRNRYKANELNVSGIHLLDGDLFAVPSLPDDLDCIIHIAGITKACQAADYYTVNQQGTASLLQSVLSQKINLKRFIHLSSLAASGPGDGDHPILESDSPSPISHYGKSKLEAEKEVLSHADFFPVVVLRAAVIFGPRDPGFLPYMKIIKKGILPSPGFRSGFVSTCYIRDLIRAIDLAIDKPLQSGEIFNIADAKPSTWDDLGVAAGKALGVNLRRIRIPRFVVFLHSCLSEFKGRIKNDPVIFNRDKYFEMKQKSWVADTDKAKELLGFVTQNPFESAVRETVEWYLKKGWL